MSTKVWYCANCGYEVTNRGRCHSCGERLTASPLPELDSGPDDDEVGYRLDQWDDPTRGRLIAELVGAGVLHRFEDEELVVLAVDEAEVDRLVARVSGVGKDADDDEEEPVAPLEGDRDAAREVYDAARRLREDPTDMHADAALSEASALLFAAERLPGMDEDHMAAIGRVTRRLLGALGADEAMEDEIGHQSELLCRLVAPAAGEDEAQREEARARLRLEEGAKKKGRLVELPQSDVTPAGENVSALPAGAQEAPAASEVAGAASSPTAEPEGGFVATPVPLASAGPPAEAEDEVADELVGEMEDEELEETGELVFELVEWLPEQRVELSLLLESAGIAYNWDGSDLTVAEEHEGEVESLFEQVHGLADEDDEVRYRMIEELFRAVDRLANDPASEERQQAFMTTVGAVEQPTPVGVDDAFWWRIRSQGRTLARAIEVGGRPDEVTRSAALLAEMLHEMV